MNLRTAGEDQPRKSLFFYIILMLLAFTGLYAAGNLWRGYLAQRSVQTEDLQVSSEVSLIQGADQVLVTADRLYVPAPGLGTYFVQRRLNPSLTVAWQLMGISGRTLAGVAADGEPGVYILPDSIALVDVETGAEQPLLQYDPDKFAFSQPCFASDQSFLWLTRENLTESAGSKEIVRIDTATGELFVVTAGECPSLDKPGKNLVFARKGHIYSLDLSANREQLLTAGYAPARAPFSDYIAYLTAGGTEVALISAGNPHDVFTVTANVKGSGGSGYLYQYGAPVWDSEEPFLYVPRYNREKQEWNINRYQLGHELPEAEEMAAEWLAGVAQRDEEIIYRYYPEYAGELSHTPVDLLLGYHLLDVSLKDGGLYIRGEQISMDEAGSYYIQPFALTAASSKHGYRFNSLVMHADKRSSYIIADDGVHGAAPSATLDIPVDGVVMAGYDAVYQSVVYLRATEGGYELNIYATVPRQTEALPGSISASAVPLSLSFSSNGHVMALLYREADELHAAMYNLKKRTLISAPFMHQLRHMLWVGDQLVVSSGNADITLHWFYAPSQGVITL